MKILFVFGCKGTAIFRYYQIFFTKKQFLPLTYPIISVFSLEPNPYSDASIEFLEIKFVISGSLDIGIVLIDLIRI